MQPLLVHLFSSSAKTGNFYATDGSPLIQILLTRICISKFLAHAQRTKCYITLNQQKISYERVKGDDFWLPSYQKQLYYNTLAGLNITQKFIQHLTPSTIGFFVSPLP